MKMDTEKLFEIKEHWTYEKFKTVNLIFQKKIRKNLLVCNVISIVMIIYCLLTEAWFCFARGHFSIVVLVCGFVGAFTLFLIPNIFKKRIEEAWKIAPDCNGYEQTVEFYEGYLIVKRNDGEIRYAYDKFENMIEYDSYIFLLLSKNMSFMIQKDACSMELLEFLRGKF